MSMMSEDELRYILRKKNHKTISKELFISCNVFLYKFQVTISANFLITEVMIKTSFRSCKYSFIYSLNKYLSTY